MILHNFYSNHKRSGEKARKENVKISNNFLSSDLIIYSWSEYFLRKRYIIYVCLASDQFFLLSPRWCFLWKGKIFHFHSQNSPMPCFFFKQAVYLSVGQFSLTFQEFFWHKQLCETAVKNINNKSYHFFGSGFIWVCGSGSECGKAKLAGCSL